MASVLSSARKHADGTVRTGLSGGQIDALWTHQGLTYIPAQTRGCKGVVAKVWSGQISEGISTDARLEFTYD